MIFSVEKRHYRRNGKLQFTRCYYLRYRLENMPVDRWKSLAVTDKVVAEKRAHEFIQEKEREAAGLIAPRLMRDSAQKPLAEHLDDYVADLEVRNRAGRRGRGGRLLKGRILRLLKACGWKLPGNVTADSFVTWRNRQTGAARTLNHYLQGMVSFLNWLERSGRIQANPLKFVDKVDERGQKKRLRRAFTDDELQKLIAGSGSRGIIYFTAARTGLRQEELKQLKWCEIDLESPVPRVVVRAETAKNKKEEAVCLVPEIVTALKAYRPTNWSPADLVFPQGIPNAAQIKVDEERNGLVYCNPQGRYADFHALRYTWATYLQRHGVGQRIAMKLMRHSDIRLTSKVYTDEMQLPVYDAIKDLPQLGECTHRYAQISDSEGQNVSQAGAKDDATKSQENAVNTGVWRSLSLPDVKKELAEREGFEPSIDHEPIPVFETGAFNHSATSPLPYQHWV